MQMSPFQLRMKCWHPEPRIICHPDIFSAAPPTTLAAQKVDFSEDSRQRWGERGERQLKVEGRAKMNHSAACEQVRVWTDQRNPEIVWVCVLLSNQIFIWACDPTQPPRWGWVDGGHIFPGGCWLACVFLGCPLEQVLPSGAERFSASNEPLFLSSHHLQLVSCSSVFFLSLIFCAPFTFHFSCLPLFSFSHLYTSICSFPYAFSHLFLAFRPLSSIYPHF